VNIKRLRGPRRKNILKIEATTTKIILQNWTYTNNSIDENIDDINIIGKEHSVAEAKKKIESLIENVMRESTAIIPPLQSPLKAKSHLDKTPMQQHQQNLEKTIWTEEEKKIFKEKFSPKTENNFAKVSEYINKDVKECIQFYYLNKKKENLRKTV
jgi:rRNA processing protein Krr1/Pno1